MKKLVIKLIVLLCSAFSVLSVWGQSQHLVLNTYSGESEISALSSVTLTNGFHAVGNLRIFISEFPQSKLELTTGKNYILTRVMRSAGINRSNIYTTKNADKETQEVQYFDDIGRVVQKIHVAGSPTFKDIIEHVDYDLYGRHSKQYQPYAESVENKGGFNSNALNRTLEFYGGATGNTGWDSHVQKTKKPYSQTIFEGGPLNRITAQGAQGEEWQPETGHTQKIAYGANVGTGKESVKIWKVNSGDNGASSTEYYPGGKLSRITKRDENIVSTSKSGIVEEYYDQGNMLILQRKWTSETEFLSTYYVYNDFGDLRYVIPPSLMEKGAPSEVGVFSFAENDVAFEQYIYGYKYDEKRRVIEQKIPGQGKQLFVYNILDQLVLSQDSMLRAQGQWNVLKYDVEGREILSGIYTNATDKRDALQSLLNGRTTNLYENRVATSIGYTNHSFPESVDIYTFNYYDDYSFPNNKFGSEITQGVGVNNVKGLLTGSLVKTIGQNEMLLSTFYYDNKGQNIRSVQENHLQGTVVVNTAFDFLGNITSQNIQDPVLASMSPQINTRYKYDHVGRLLNVYKRIGAANEVVISGNFYNELGQLREKGLHSENNGSNYLTTVKYNYNERGWLKAISSPHFTEILKYQDGTFKQWNGNISNQLWGNTQSTPNEFVYKYDEVGRLSNGTSTGLVMSEDISYDAMGNISRLIRDGQTNNYTYNGNKLAGVTGGINTQTYRYDGNGNAVFDGRNGFNYSYNHLNLPVSVNSGSTNRLTNSYDANGVLLHTTTNNNGITSRRDYIGSITYNKLGTANRTVDFIHTEEGYAQNNGGAYTYLYYLRDHLGNVRSVIDKNGGSVRVLQRQDYYPFGKLSKTNLIVGSNNHLYNGKELLQDLSADDLNGQYNYGARYYDPEIARWNVADPLAQADYSSSPYSYVNGNPIYYNDPTGMIANPFIKNNFTGQIKWIPEGAKISDGWSHYAQAWYRIEDVTVTAVSKKLSAYNSYFEKERDIVKQQYRKEAGALFMGYPKDLINSRTIQRIENDWSTREFVYIQNKFDGSYHRFGTGNGALEDANWVIDLATGGVTAGLRAFGARSAAKISMSLADDVAVNLVDDAARGLNSSAHLTTEGVNLSKHLRQLEKYGQAGFKELQNGRIRYYGNVTEASSPGEMIGRRVVREWNPATGGKRTWMETLDGAGSIRIVRPQTGGTKVHFMFDKSGNFIKKW